jgi:ABC-type multidrug transport system ATPase subunit
MICAVDFTIMILAGILSPSGGEMLVSGESVTTEGGLDRIRPQVSTRCQVHVSAMNMNMNMNMEPISSG